MPTNLSQGQQAMTAPRPFQHKSCKKAKTLSPGHTGSCHSKHESQISQTSAQIHPFTQTSYHFYQPGGPVAVTASRGVRGTKRHQVEHLSVTICRFHRPRDRRQPQTPLNLKTGVSDRDSQCQLTSLPRACACGGLVCHLTFQIQKYDSAQVAP